MDGSESSISQSETFNMIIGVIGNGFVGHAMTLLRPAIDVQVWDIAPEKCEPAGLSFDQLVKESDVIFTALPTPMSSSGECHTDIVSEMVDKIRCIDDNKIIVSRSTTPPGTCDKLGINFMPEFLTERAWRTDFINCEQWIIGTHDDQVYDVIDSLFKLAKKGDRIVNDCVIRTTPTEGEMIKYIKNCFLAVKVGFFNEMHSICEAANINFEKVRSISCDDSRLNHVASLVPGPDGLPGFGGTCLPKDINALLCHMRYIGVESHILKSVIERNETLDRPGKDWNDDKGRAVV